MKVYAMLAVLLLGLLSGVHGVEFDCSTMNPEEDSQLTKAITNPPFGLSVSPDTIESGGSLTVKLYSTQNGLAFTSFIVAAHNMLEDETPIGSWSVDDSLIATDDCQESTAAVIRQATYDPKLELTATWTAPSNLMSNVEFMATVSIGNGTYWYEINSIQISRVTPNVENQPAQPEVVLEDDLHSDLKESQQALAAELRKQEMIDAEIRDSEGDWQKAEVEAEVAHQQMMQWELQQYELRVQQEEEQRQARIREEVMDQEEHMEAPEPVDREEEKEEIEEHLEEEAEEILNDGDGILSDENVIDLNHFLRDSAGASNHQVASIIAVFVTALMAAIL